MKEREKMQRRRKKEGKGKFLGLNREKVELEHISLTFVHQPVACLGQRVRFHWQMFKLLFTVFIFKSWHATAVPKMSMSKINRIYIIQTLSSWNASLN